MFAYLSSLDMNSNDFLCRNEFFHVFSETFSYAYKCTMSWVSKNSRAPTRRLA